MAPDLSNIALPIYVVGTRPVWDARDDDNRRFVRPAPMITYTSRTPKTINLTDGYNENRRQSLDDFRGHPRACNTVDSGTDRNRDMRVI